MELETASATSAAALILVEHLFAQSDASIPGLSYAVTYKLAEGHAGGDIIDIYHFDNDAVAISIADIAGKARNSRGELYGMERLISIVRQHANSPEPEIVEALLKDAVDFCGGRRRDDIAIVAARFH